ncbi:MAG: 50S ribosomal protein L10 [Nitrospirota bacterium]|nr:MAG: 50S ribosomal protein L10 [Nitrospirota bacterium]
MFRLPGSLGKEDNLNRQEKKEVVEELKDRFSRAKAVVLTDYKGLSVEEMYEARSKFRDANVEYKVVKNTLAKIATEDTPIAGARDHFEGPIGIAIGYDDPVIVAKSVLDYSKDNEKFEVKCGVVEGTFFQAAELKSIATLPSRDMLLSMMAGAFSAPMSKLAAGLRASLARFGYALEALKSKKTE